MDKAEIRKKKEAYHHAFLSWHLFTFSSESFIFIYYFLSLKPCV